MTLPLLAWLPTALFHGPGRAEESDAVGTIPAKMIPRVRINILPAPPEIAVRDNTVVPLAYTLCGARILRKTRNERVLRTPERAARARRYPRESLGFSSHLEVGPPDAVGQVVVPVARVQRDQLCVQFASPTPNGTEGGRRETQEGQATSNGRANAGAVVGVVDREKQSLVRVRAGRCAGVPRFRERESGRKKPRTTTRKV